MLNKKTTGEREKDLIGKQYWKYGYPGNIIFYSFLLIITFNFYFLGCHLDFNDWYLIYSSWIISLYVFIFFYYRVQYCDTRLWLCIPLSFLWPSLCASTPCCDCSKTYLLSFLSGAYLYYYIFLGCMFCFVLFC